MNNHPILCNPDQVYGYYVCPIAVANEEITASQNHRYHLTVIQSMGCDPPMDNCVLATTYELYLDELVSFVRQSDHKIISIERLSGD